MNRWKRFGPWMLILGLLTYTSLFTACSDDPVDPEPPGPETALDQLQIICRELAPAPGEIARLTVQVDGYSPAEWPTYTWDDGGAGTFIDGNTGISVEWQAPAETGLYRIEVIGTLGALADTTEKWVMVRNFEEIDTGRIFSCHPRFLFNTLYFFGDADDIPPRSPDFKGYMCYNYVSPGTSGLVTNTGEALGGGYDLYLPEDGSFVVGSFIRTYFSGLQQQRQDLWAFPLTIGSAANVTDDGSGAILRKNQHVKPYTTQFGGEIVWEARLAGGAMDGTQDLADIGYWDSFLQDTVYVTESHDSSTVQLGSDVVTLHRYYNNIKPSFTPDEDMIVYFVDTTGVFEPCIIDLISGNPDIGTRRALMVTDSRGIFESAGINVNSSTVFHWNPTMNILGFLASGNLCYFDPYSETVTVIPGEHPTEMRWSPDGTQCAVAVDAGVVLVTATGVVDSEPIYVKEKSTDGIIGLTWSDDTVDPKLAFRMIRKGKSVEDSFSALVIVHINEGISAYASPSVNWSQAYEPNIDYTYMRLLFDGNGNLYAPIPTPSWSGDPDRDVECAIFRSYE